MLNIAGLEAVDDPEYRYRMPALMARIEGRGNGIKTCIDNLRLVAGALHRDPAEVSKFFGTTLGAQSSYNATEDRAIVNGAHTTEALQGTLSRYIEGFVLCGNCRLPETEYKIKNGAITQVCAACGSKTPVDMSQRLTTFILNQHARAKKEGSGGGKKKKDKRERRAARQQQRGGGGVGGGASADSDDDSGHAGAAGPLSTSMDDEDAGSHGHGSSKKKKKKKDKDRSHDEKKKKKKKDKKKHKSSSSRHSGSDDEESDPENFNLDEDQEAAAEDAAALENASAGFRRFMDSDQGAAAGPAELLAELRSIQTFAALTPKDKVIIFMGAVFTEDAARTNEIEQHAEVLQHISNVAVNAADIVSQREVIAGLEWFCGIRFPTLVRWFPAMLKQLYDTDVIEEAAFNEWNRDEPRNEYTASAFDGSGHDETLAALRTAAQPFLKWLAEAESDDSGNDSGESDSDSDEDGDGDDGDQKAGTDA